MECDQKLVLTTHERDWRNPVSGLCSLTYVKYVLLAATAGPAYLPMFDYYRAACFGIRSHTFIKAGAKKLNNLDAGK
jgi:hypothetical protein